VYSCLTALTESIISAPHCPTLVGLVRRELAVEHIRRDCRGRTFAVVLQQGAYVAAPAPPERASDVRSCAKPHEKPASSTLRQIRWAPSVRALATKLAVTAGMIASSSRERAPGGVSATHGSQTSIRRALRKLSRRPDGAVLRNEAELHVDFREVGCGLC